MGVTIDEILVADEPSAWQAAGFTVEDDLCRIGAVRVRLVGRDRGTGVVGWSLRDVPPGGLVAGALDGLPTTVSTTPPVDPAEHALGVTGLDHVVVTTPDLARTVAALEAVGLDVRRERDTTLGDAPLRQIFFRLGDVVLELVGSPHAAGDGPATIWGLTHTVADVNAAAALLGEHTGRVKDAVQPGRRITTVRHTALDMSVATALITPRGLSSRHAEGE